MSDESRRRRAVDFILRTRTDRSEYFSDWLFSDPAWDILLAAYVAGLDEKDVAVSAIAETTNLLISTVDRWITALQKEGLVLRRAASSGDRVSLSEPGRLAMDRYIDGLPQGTP